MKRSSYKRSKTEGMKTTGCNPAAAYKVLAVWTDRRERGRWLVKKADIEGMTPAQIKDYLALPGNDLPNKIVDVNIPPDIRLRTGKAAPTSGGNGGANQFEIPFPDNVDPSWFGIPKDL